jgi:hypothetical protein
LTLPRSGTHHFQCSGIRISGRRRVALLAHRRS